MILFLTDQEETLLIISLMIDLHLFWKFFTPKGKLLSYHHTHSFVDRFSLDIEWLEAIMKGPWCLIKLAGLFLRLVPVFKAKLLITGL